MSIAHQTLADQYENIEISIQDKNINDQSFQQSNGINNNDSQLISKHPSLLINTELKDENLNEEIISLIDEYPKLVSLKEFMTKTNSNNNKLTVTQKLIIILGTAIGIQYLHVNDQYHGNLCLKNIFLDENLYPHIFIPNPMNYSLSFEEKDKNEIIDITSLCFITYELIIEQAIYDEGSKIDEKLMNFDLSKTNNEWQKSFLKKFWPKNNNYLNINDIIEDIINNNKKFGDINEDEILVYIHMIKKYQKSYLIKLENEIKISNDPKKMLVYGRLLTNFHLYDGYKKEASKYFKKASNLGSIDAMYEYGMILKIGNQTNENLKKSMKYFETASKNGHTGAIYEYGTLLILELTIDKIQQGKELIKIAADKGYIKAQFIYGAMINSMKLSEALTYYKDPADFGYSVAMNNLGLFLFELKENEFEDSASMAVKYLKMAMSLDFIKSFFNYGVYLIDGNKIPKNEDEGKKYIKYAADNGLLIAIKKYAEILVDDGLSNIPEVLQYIKIAADKNDHEAMNIYGTILQKGVLIDKDISEAGRYFQMAFLNNNNNVESMFNYGKMILEENNDDDGIYYINECIKKEYLPAKLYMIEREEKMKNESNDLIEECKTLADNGNVESMYNYAIILYNGEGIEENKEEAAKYYKMAAEKGHIGSMHNYATMLFNGDGIEKNIVEAVKYYKIAADNGHDISTSFVGIILYDGDETIQDKEEGLKYIKRAIEYEFSYPKDFYNMLLKRGEIEEEKKAQIALKLRKGIYDGDMHAMFSFALMLLNGDGVYKSRKDAAEYFKMAAEKGHLMAMEEYGIMLQTGNGIPVNKVEAAKWLKLSADRGCCTSMFLYAKMLANGNGIKTNKKEAAKYYKIAADQGLPVSMNNYGVMLNDGDGIEANKEIALKYLKKAAHCGDAMGIINYNVIQEITENKSSNNNNDNTNEKPNANENDNNKYINCIKKLADEGDNDAMLIYGNLLYNGNKIPKDKKEAAKYYKLAADKGSIASMHKYAEMMENGDGIPTDIQEAIKYYQKALLKNDTKASEKLNQLSIYFSCCH